MFFIYYFVKIFSVSEEKNGDDIYQFFASRKEETQSGDIHIHLVAMNTQRYSDFILLKEYLLKNKEESKKYSDFKRKLIGDNITERETYKKLKSEYVSMLLKKARH